MKLELGEKRKNWRKMAKGQNSQEIAIKKRVKKGREGIEEKKGG